MKPTIWEVSEIAYENDLTSQEFQSLLASNEVKDELFGNRIRKNNKRL